MSEWKKFHLTELFDVQIGGTPSRGVSQYWANTHDHDSIPWVSIADMSNTKTIYTTKERISPQGYSNSNAKLVPIGTLLFSFKLTIGKLAFAGVELTTNEAIASLFTKTNQVDTRFIYYVLPSIFDKIVYDTAVKGKTLNKKKIAEIEIFAPVSKNEQTIIANILESVDKVIEYTEAAIEKYKAIKTGMIQDLFTRGIDVNTGKLRPSYKETPELYKQTEMGWIPKKWEVVTIGDFAKIKGGKRMPAGTEFSDLETPYPYLRVTDMQDGTINQSDIKYVPMDIEPIIRSYKISCDDIYVTIAGTLGLFGTIPDNLDEAQLTENAARITEYDETQYTRDFIKHQCNSRIIQNQVNREIGVGGGVPKLALYRIARFKFFKPSITEQSVICERMNTISDIIEKEQNILAKTQSLKQGLMSDLLTGKVRVNYNDSIEVKNGTED
jgi:type I restriction enzyme S subunit